MRDRHQGALDPGADQHDPRGGTRDTGLHELFDRAAELVRLPRGNGACVRVSRARDRVPTILRAGPAPFQDLVDKDREVSRDGSVGGFHSIEE
ncbi:hypothetical protein GCM10009696_35940 [Kocuria himachalensis]